MGVTRSRSSIGTAPYATDRIRFLRNIGVDRLPLADACCAGLLHPPPTQLIRVALANFRGVVFAISSYQRSHVEATTTFPLAASAA